MSQAKKKKKSGGTLMGMRSGFQRAVGQGKKKKKGGKKQWTFVQVLYLVGGIAVAIALFWLMTKQ